MPEPQNSPAATPKTAETPEPSLLAEAGKETDPNVMKDADAQKQAQEVEEKRLLDADPKTLSKEDQDKRVVVEKTREEKRLLETPDDKLNDADKVKKAELVKAKEAQVKAKQVPEKYEFKVPEGMTLDQALVDKVSPVFKAKGFTQEQAQAAVDIYIDIQKAAGEAQAASFKQFLKDSYDETVKALGAKYKEEIAYAAKVRDRFLSEETQEILNASGLSNNKAFILDLIKLGKLISEDKLPDGKSAKPAAGKSPAEIMYPEQDKK